MLSGSIHKHSVCIVSVQCWQYYVTVPTQRQECSFFLWTEAEWQCLPGTIHKFSVPQCCIALTTLYNLLYFDRDSKSSIVRLSKSYIQLTWIHSQTRYCLMYCVCEYRTICVAPVIWVRFQLKSSQWMLSPLTDSAFLATLVNKGSVLLLSTLVGTNKGDLNWWGQMVYVAIILQPKTWEAFQTSHRFLCTACVVLNSWWKVVTYTVQCHCLLKVSHIEIHI